jgi:hypothetical protein
MQRALLCSLAVLATTCLSGISLGDPSAPPPEHASGTWQKHQYSFVFMGFTSTYSCDGLADKLRTILLAAGARADAKSRPGACASPFGHPDRFARADLTFYTLSSAPSSDATKPVEGVWRAVRLSDRTPREVQVGDCELIEQFRNQVLPMFTTRNIEDHTTCVPHQESGSEIDLKFDSLSAVPAPKVAAK